MVQHGTQASLAAVVVALIAAATSLYYRDAYNASELEIVPDSVEYATAACAWVEEGHYQITVSGVPHPPRYGPGFSTLFLAPAYALLGPEPGNGVFAVHLLALLGVAAAAAIGHRVAGVWGALAAGAALAFLPDFVTSARSIMTDAPAAALAVIALWLYVRRGDGQHLSAASLGAAGIVTALALAIRPVMGALLIPFMVAACRAQSLPRRLGRLALLLAPAGAVILATLTYQHAVFGSYLRNGYSYWCAVPYDYPGLTFAVDYLPKNLLVLARTPVPWLVSLVVLLAVRERQTPAHRDSNPLAAGRRGMLFAILAGIPIVLFHLPYFYADARFLLSPSAMLAVISAAIAGRLLPPPRPRILALCLLAVVLLGIASRALYPLPEPHRRRAADRIARHTPDNAVIVSAVNPVYLEHRVARPSHRTIVPLDVASNMPPNL